MAWTSGFFDSANGDRVYNAKQMSQLFEGLITNGICRTIGDKFIVEPNGGMKVQIGTGRGWFGHRWANNDSAYILTLEPSDVLLNRWACIVIRSDESTRGVVPAVKYGEFSENPTRPDMIQTDSINEYCLAYVYIGAGVTSITAEDIRDTRANERLCGFVDSLAAAPISLTVTIPPESWDGFEAMVYLDAMTATKTVFCQASDESKDVYNEAGINMTLQSNGSVTFRCFNHVPTEAVKVNITYMGV